MVRSLESPWRDSTIEGLNVLQTVLSSVQFILYTYSLTSLKMKAASLNEIKKELVTLEADTLLELCMRLGKYKKENKELLTYLLFEASDEPAYIESVKGDIDELFRELPKGNLYFVKKSLRKILRMTNKQIRYSGVKQSELELRIHFCTRLKNSGIRLDRSPVLLNLYQQQLKRINLALAKLPEDLQFDFQRAVESL